MKYVQRSTLTKFVGTALNKICILLISSDRINNSEENFWNMLIEKMLVFILLSR